MLEKLITDAMGSVNYLKVGSGIYKASWSNDVEHFVYVEKFGNSKSQITARFGFRNVQAELFSEASILKYGGDLYRNSRRNPKNQCFMNFSFGRLTSPITRWKLDSRALDAETLQKTLIFDISEKLLPLIRTVNTLPELYKLLLINSEPIPWVVVNTAIRAAQTVSVGIQIGMSESDIYGDLEPLKRDIGSNLLGEIDVEPFLVHLFEDAHSFSNY